MADMEAIVFNVPAGYPEININGQDWEFEPVTALWMFEV